MTDGECGRCTCWIIISHRSLLLFWTTGNIFGHYSPKTLAPSASLSIPSSPCSPLCFVPHLEPVSSTPQSSSLRTVGPAVSASPGLLLLLRLKQTETRPAALVEL